MYEVEIIRYMYNEYGDYSGEDQRVVRFADKEEVISFFNESKTEYDEVLLKDIISSSSIGFTSK